MPATGGEKRILVEMEKGVTPYMITWTSDNGQMIFQTGLHKSKIPSEIYRVPVNGGDPELILQLDDLLSGAEIASIVIFAKFRDFSHKTIKTVIK